MTIIPILFKNLEQSQNAINEYLNNQKKFALLIKSV